MASSAWRRSSNYSARLISSETMLSVWVYGEVFEGQLRPAALELVTRARELGAVEAVALGHGASSSAAALGRHGAVCIRVCEHEVYAEHPTEPATDTLTALVERDRPDLLLFAATPDSRDVAGRLAVRLGVGVIANAVAVEVEGGL